MNANLKKSRPAGMGWAVLLICAGAVFLLLNLGIIPAIYKPILISWQMLLIALGLWSLIQRHYLGGILLIVVGGIFIYPQLYTIFPDYFLDIDISFKTYWPVLLIVVGLFIVFNKNKFCKQLTVSGSYCSNKSYTGDSGSATQKGADYLEKHIMFGSAEQIVLSSNFKGGEANVMFGELILDLRKAKLADGSTNLEVNILFGSAILYVPSDWVVDVQNSTVFGGFQDNRNVKDGEDMQGNPHLIIRGGCMFGSGEIRN
ncbi:LiaI-LiaF-like domain-containing protein [Dysgonomonas sp. ZJ709]|uniref:LiaF transmembrane domain-containing protein n=1 Tax=Dysgonomonas sp. ZJ709 TaxID=2709797 RepID=UPI0013ED753A|nr:DUF5668 domain-containing protein [Dysgonomonas sp. ZJ709]